jgi:hypothetical protein
LKGEVNMEIKNAKITSTMLGREDHGIMTFMIFVEFDVCVGCGVGGYALDSWDKITSTRVFRAESMEAISKVLDVVGVDRWEKLPGSYIRIKDNGWGSTIDEIGNLMEDKWFNLREFFSKEN